ncbi:MAG TPA: alanine racemase [Polyangia bacterium]|jgi:D-serine deaminase-like pyridoxal phosphate-dependent protein|nr:alanine racemase [Polyangia bacterium]
MNAFDLETPSVYVDLDALERNIARMQARCRQWGVGLRPHTKTHKIVEIARMQLEAGAVGITVAKLGEAEVLPGDDVLVAYPVMAEKLPRLRALGAKRRVTVVVDSAEAAQALPGIATLVEVDVGAGRCGVQTPEQAVAVARACGDFRGLFYWPSWLDEAGFARARTMLDGHVAALQAAGFAVPIISGGSTPGAGKTPLIPATTEIRPGTYVFNDASCVANGFATIEDCALRVLVSVVSTSVPGQAVIDGGSKTFSSDTTVGVGTHGIFPERPSWTLQKLNEEHGYVKVDAGDPARPRIAEKFWVIPSHVCSAVNMHDEIAYGRNGRVDGTWRVAARGRVR